MARFSCFMGAAFWLLTACGQSAGVSSAIGAAQPCIDSDGDGFGVDCALGRDCNDRDEKITHECRACAHPEPGCACASDQVPIPCFLPDTQLPDGNVMCHEGTRTCRDGLWSQCEGILSYYGSAREQPHTTALVELGATPEN